MEKFGGHEGKQPAGTQSPAGPRRAGRSYPKALQRALNGVTPGDQFFTAVSRAAENAGCHMLFELPAMLLHGNGDRAAAIACGPDHDLIFIVFDSANGEIMVISSAEAPETVLDFTRSYAGVLGMIASDRNVTAPLLQ
jgi:hypothetical protein